MKASRRKVIFNMGLEIEQLAPEAVKAFFAYTDRGEPPPRFSCAKSERDFWELGNQHRHRDIFERMWAEDFRGKAETGYIPLLFPQDFRNDHPGIKQRAVKVYERVFGFIPKAFDNEEEILK